MVVVQERAQHWIHEGYLKENTVERGELRVDVG